MTIQRSDSVATAVHDSSDDEQGARERLAQVRRERDAQLLDLGGLVFDLHRLGQRRDELVITKLDLLLTTERRRRDCEAQLGDLPVVLACLTCAAKLLPSQEWCLECGADVLTANAQVVAPAQTNGHVLSATNGHHPKLIQPITSPARASDPVPTVETRRRQVSIGFGGGALALVAVLVAVVVFVARGSESSAISGDPAPAAVTAVATVPDVEEVTPSAPLSAPLPTGPEAWPAGVEAYTVIVVTTNNQSGADRLAAQLFKAGVTTTGVINGREYKDGPGGLYQTYAGRFDTKAQAQASADQLAAKGYDGFVQEIKAPATPPA